jgi:hypothetical protein
MSSPIVYIDEDLPEIIVREYITGIEEDEIQEDGNKIGVNVHSHEELMDQLLILLQKLKGTSSLPIRRKAEAILNIHKELLSPKPFILSASMLPKLTINRKDVSGMDAEYLEKYTEIQKIENYEVRRDALNKLFFTYESSDINTPPQWKSEFFSHTIELETGDKVRLLPKDNLSGKVESIKVSKGLSAFDINFDKLSLKDKVISSSIPWKEWKIEEERLEDFIKKYLDEQWKESFSWNQEIVDLYEAWKRFITYGIDINNLTESQWTEWISHLESLKDKDKEIFDFLKPLEHVPQSLNFQEHGGYAFYLLHRELIHKLAPIISILQDNLLNLYKVFLESIPPISLDTSKIPKTIYELTMAIYEQSADLNQVIDLLKIAILKERLQDLEQWMRIVQSWDIEEIENKIEYSITKYKQTLESIHDEPHLPLNSLNAELKKIKKGTVITADVDETENRADEIFESVEDFVVEDDDPEEITIRVYDDILPLNIHELDESQKERLEVAIRMLMEVQRASGLPLNYEEVHQKIPYMPRLSKLTQLKEALPEHREEFLKTLTQFEIVDINTFIEANVEPVDYAHVKQALEKIRKHFLIDIFEYIAYFIAIWVTELQQSVLSRSLGFEVWQGSVNCIQVWSPYGMPMEGIKIKKDGIVPYLLCILHDLTFTEGSIWNKYGISFTKDDFIQRWIELYEEPLKDTVVVLQERFKSFEKDILHRNLLERGEKIKHKIIETVEQRNKNRYLNDYMNFLQNLPSVLIQSSIAKKIHIGCCLQSLSDKYRADYDWAALVKEAYRIKKLYATQRFGTDKRPSLVKILRDIEISEKSLHELPNTYIQYEVMPFEKITEWYERVKEFTPIKDYQEMTTAIRNLIPLTEKYIAIYAQTIGILTRDINEYIMEKLGLQELMQLYRKVLQSQYVFIQTDMDHKDFLLSKWNELEGLINFLSSLHGYFNEVQEQNAKRFLQYFIIRQLCFPAKPEYAVNQTLVITDINVPADLVKNFISKVNKEIDNWFQVKVFQRRTDFIEYIGKERERENLEKLQLIDMMNPEERKLYVDAKKLGLEELKEYLERFKERQMEEKEYQEIDDVYERTGEEEFYPKRGENDDEVNPDSFNDDEY